MAAADLLKKALEIAVYISMATLFFAPLFLILGLISPAWVIRTGPLQKKTRVRVVLFWLAISFVSSIVGGLGAYYLQQEEEKLADVSTNLEVSVVKGPLADADVAIYELLADGSRGALLVGPIKSDANGGVNLEKLGLAGKRLLIEAAGGNYKSEVTGQKISLTKNDVLRAVLPIGTGRAAVTPFTHMAAELARQTMAAGAEPDAAILYGLTTVAQRYGLSSVLDVVPSPAEAAGTASLDGRRYGVLLGGFEQLSQNLKVGPIVLAEALAHDAADGVLDGLQAAAPVPLGKAVLPADAGTLLLQKAVTTFAKSRNNKSGLADLSISLDSGRSDAAFYISAATLPAWISGLPGTFAIAARGGKPPLAWKLAPGSSLPEGFAMTAGGVITGTSILPKGVTKKIFPAFTVEVADAAGTARRATFSITVVPRPPIVTVLDVGTLETGGSYAFKFADGSEGVPPYVFKREVGGGALPFGLSLSKEGLIQGSPRAKGRYAFRICVVDAAGTEDCNKASLTVIDPEKKPEAVEQPAPPAPLPAPKKNVIKVVPESDLIDSVAPQPPAAAVERVEIELVLAGSGAGTVNTASDLDAVCVNGDCGRISIVKGARVTFTPTAGENSVFRGFSGACSGLSACTLTVSAPIRVQATFEWAAASASPEQPAEAPPAPAAPASTSPVDYGMTIDSASCAYVRGPNWDTDPYMTEQMSGTMWGPLNVSVGFSTSYDIVSCGSWTKGDNNGCWRKPGQPERTAWNITTGPWTVGGPFSGVITFTVYANIEHTTQDVWSTVPYELRAKKIIRTITCQ